MVQPLWACCTGSQNSEARSVHPRCRDTQACEYVYVQYRNESRHRLEASPSALLRTPLHCRLIIANVKGHTHPRRPWRSVSFVHQMTGDYDQKVILHLAVEMNERANHLRAATSAVIPKMEIRLGVLNHG